MNRHLVSQPFGCDTGRIMATRAPFWPFTRSACIPETGRSNRSSNSRFPMFDRQFRENPIGNRFRESVTRKRRAARVSTALSWLTFVFGRVPLARIAGVINLRHPNPTDSIVGSHPQILETGICRAFGLSCRRSLHLVWPELLAVRRPRVMLHQKKGLKSRRSKRRGFGNLPLAESKFPCGRLMSPF